MTRASAARIAFASVCQHETRTYSVLPDGSALRAFPRSTEKLTPLAISGDGRSIVYRGGPDVVSGHHSDSVSGVLSVSRGDGSALHAVGQVGNRPALSRDGSQLAFMKGNRLWVVGSDGGGARQVASGVVRFDVSPDGKLVVLETWASELVVRRLDVARRVALPISGTYPKWSPDGRWIAYHEFVIPGRVGVMRPDGTGRRWLQEDDAVGFTWSPDSKMLALLTLGKTAGGISILGADGRERRRLGVEVDAADVRWSPDGRLLALGGLGDVHVVGATGRGLHTLTDGCWNTLVGWTPLAPL
jgi:Tol biopolymer transport system component